MLGRERRGDGEQWGVGQATPREEAFKVVLQSSLDYELVTLINNNK